MTTADLRQAALAFAQAVDMAARVSGDAHERLVLAWQRYLVTLRPEALPPPVREHFLRLHDRVCGRPPGGAPGDYIATFKALDPEDDAELLAQLVELKNAMRLLLEEHAGEARSSPSEAAICLPASAFRKKPHPHCPRRCPLLRSGFAGL